MINAVIILRPIYVILCARCLSCAFMYCSSFGVVELITVSHREVKQSRRTKGPLSADQKRRNSSEDPEANLLHASVTTSYGTAPSTLLVVALGLISLPLPIKPLPEVHDLAALLTIWSLEAVLEFACFLPSIIILFDTST